MKTHPLLNKIKKEFPNLEWKEHKYVTHGWNHDVIILDNKLVFRAPKTIDYKKQLSDEIKFLNYLKLKIKNNIPQYKYFSKNSAIAGYDLVKGTELKADHFKKLSSTNKNIVAKNLANFFTSLHQTPTSIAKKHPIKTVNPEILYKNLVKKTKKLIFPCLNKKDIKIIENYFYQLKNIINFPHTKAVIHNDLSYKHILWDSKNKQINIIDFSDRAIGDPALDLAVCFEYGPKFAKKVLDLYQGKKDKQILNRAKLFYQAVPLWVMENTISMPNCPTNFKEGYEIFKNRFRI